MAPGVAILAAIVPKADEGSSPPIGSDSQPPGYAMKSGTSMACPHVAGRQHLESQCAPCGAFPPLNLHS